MRSRIQRLIVAALASAAIIAFAFWVFPPEPSSRTSARGAIHPPLSQLRYTEERPQPAFVVPEWLTAVWRVVHGIGR